MTSGKIINRTNYNLKVSEVMDISLYYQEKGNGEPFILLHGNGENGNYFNNQIEYFSDRYRMIANAKLSIIKGNHFIANKKSKRFNKELEKFLETI